MGPQRGPHQSRPRWSSQAPGGRPSPCRAAGERTQPGPRRLRRHATSQVRSCLLELAGLPGGFGADAVIPLHRRGSQGPVRVVPAPRVAQGTFERGQASARAVGFCCRARVGAAVRFCPAATERRGGHEGRKTGRPSCQQCERQAGGGGVRAGRQGRCRAEPAKASTRAVGKLGPRSVEELASFWKERERAATAGIRQFQFRGVALGTRWTRGPARLPCGLRGAFGRRERVPGAGLARGGSTDSVVAGSPLVTSSVRSCI